MYLSSNIPDNKNFELFFDNWFTLLSLIHALRDKDILAVGTIRSNRIGKCPLMSAKELAKKIDQVVINYKRVEPLAECKRCCQKEKKYINISCPAIVDCYNKHMGGDDLCHMFLELYKIKNR